MNRISPSTMQWATLACLADGPDPQLSLIIKMSSPPTVIDLLKDILNSSSDSSQWQNLQSFRTLFRLLREGYAALEIVPSRAANKHLFERCKHWITKLRDIISKSDDELFDLLTYHDRYHLLSPQHEQWPFITDDLLLRAHSASPLCLWVDGAVETLSRLEHSVGVVGSREADDYGLQCAHELGAKLASQGRIVVSGGALGIDASAHWGALSTRFGANESGSSGSAVAGPTVAFFAGGLRHIGPSRNFRLFDEILAHDGALVSELPPDTVPYAARFLARNRLIAAVSKGTVLAQARHRSGAINTAQWAAEMGRIVVAIPGRIDSPMNAGCNRLIAEQKATILTSISDIDNFLPPDLAPLQEEFTLEVPHSSFNAGSTRPEESLEKKIRDLLERSQEISKEDLTARLSANFSTPYIHQILGLWEMNNVIQRNERGMITLTKH